jgi:phenylpyruvate tautomerase PptA (4-oxalocrotonate tautomerase family)
MLAGSNDSKTLHRVSSWRGSMPTYFVTTAVQRLSAAEKQAIASAITHVHNEVTDAPMFFAQIIFTEIAAGNHFVGGMPANSDAVFIHGHVRSGRSPEQKRQLLVRIIDAVGAATMISKKFIWAYIAELPPAQMAEYGHILPEPGMENTWLAGLPEADRTHVERIGRRKAQE